MFQNNPKLTLLLTLDKYLYKMESFTKWMHPKIIFHKFHMYRKRKMCFSHANINMVLKIRIL